METANNSKYGSTSLESNQKYNERSEAPKQRLLQNPKKTLPLGKPRKSNMEEQHGHKDHKKLKLRIEFFFNVLNQVLIGFVTIYLSWMCLRTGLSGIALHAWLVTIGFSFLAAEGIMCHYNGNVLTHYNKRTTKTTIHWVLQAMGGGLGVIGVLVACFQKKFVLTSVHGKLGITTLTFCLITLISGLSALFASRVKKVLTPALNKTLHNFLGLVTFALAMTTQFYGYKTGFFKKKTTEDFQILMQCLTLCSLVLTTFGATRELIHRIKTFC